MREISPKAYAGAKEEIFVTNHIGNTVSVISDATNHVVATVIGRIIPPASLTTTPRDRPLRPFAARKGKLTLRQPLCFQSGWVPLKFEN
jgi:YVTN family beta-propeller protein